MKGFYHRGHGEGEKLAAEKADATTKDTKATKEMQKTLAADER
jgi:hypothetical protein